MIKSKIQIVGIFLLLLTGCNNDSESKKIKEDSNEIEQPIMNGGDDFVPGNKTGIDFEVSEFSGQAEICAYQLKRARYNDVHPGEAVLIFVTEPFLPKEQVKSDEGSNDETVKVLKMNKIDRFTTGMYDYSMYTSVFTPTEKYDPIFPLKVSFSSQDWCGQVFSQINNSEGFVYRGFSYFQKEGDKITDHEYALIEENIFNLARMDTSLLPKGAFKVFPSQSYTRTAHIDFRKYQANASFGEKDGMIIYNYEIPELKRSVRLFLDPTKNMRIVEWTETYPTVFDGKLRTSEYKLKSTVKSPYWNKNSFSDTLLRDSLSVVQYD